MVTVGASSAPKNSTHFELVHIPPMYEDEETENETETDDEFETETPEELGYRLLLEAE